MINKNSKMKYSGTQITHIKTTYINSGKRKQFKSTFAKRHKEKAQHNGIIKFDDGLRFIPLAFASLFRFNAHVKKFEKYIIPIHP